MLHLERRPNPSPVYVYLAPIIAGLLTLVAGALLFSALGEDPGRALHAFFIKPINNLYGITELFVKATPLCLCAIGLAIGFRGNVWNIGAEGQLTLGAVAGGGIALVFHDIAPGNGWWLLPLMTLAGVMGGMAWASIPAFLRTRFNANEILVSLMLTYVALLFLSYLVHGPWRDPDGYNFPESRLFADSALLPVILDGYRFHLGGIVALFVVALGWVFVSRAYIGFQVRVVGLEPLAAGYAGFKANRIVWLSFLVGGGLAGMAGLFEVAGPIGQLNPSISPGYGFTAIIVAFLGRLHPAGILFASLIMALTYLGGDTAQIDLGLPRAITGVFQGLVLFFLLACDVLIRYRLRAGVSREGA
ncbi:MAG: ABC transporter permease [Magnetovibrionaceae bacterium]